jgi:peptidoglycan/LPS O-acetylase OafA/YrhL
MQELFPLAAGAVIGLAVQRVRSPRLRTVALVVLCLIFGALASYISGELEVSWGFLSVDALLVWVGALLAVLLVAVWRRRTASIR